MADQRQISVADVAPALAAIDALKQSVSGISTPVLRLKSAFDEFGRGSQSALRGLAANTAAFAALTTALAGAAAAAGSASALGALGGAAAIGSAAGGGGIFGALGGLFAFARGGIVPSAAQGWALPNFPGARPALLHAREMVLPAPLSEGLQRMIGDGGASGAGGGDMHLHFHGPSDGPAVERWFRGLLARNPGAVRDMLRANLLTPRTL